MKLKPHNKGEWISSQYHTQVRIGNARRVAHMYGFTWSRYCDGTLYWDQSGPDYVAEVVRKNKECATFLARQGWPPVP